MKNWLDKFEEGGGKKCPKGYTWDKQLQDCVKIYTDLSQYKKANREYQKNLALYNSNQKNKEEYINFLKSIQLNPSFIVESPDTGHGYLAPESVNPANNEPWYRHLLRESNITVSSDLDNRIKKGYDVYKKPNAIKYIEPPADEDNYGIILPYYPPEEPVKLNSKPVTRLQGYTTPSTLNPVSLPENLRQEISKAQDKSLSWEDTMKKYSDKYPGMEPIYQMTNNREGVGNQKLMGFTYRDYYDQENPRKFRPKEYRFEQKMGGSTGSLDQYAIGGEENPLGDPPQKLLDVFNKYKDTYPSLKIGKVKGLPTTTGEELQNAGDLYSIYGFETIPHSERAKIYDDYYTSIGKKRNMPGIFINNPDVKKAWETEQKLFLNIYMDDTGRIAAPFRSGTNNPTFEEYKKEEKPVVNVVSEPVKSDDMMNWDELSKKYSGTYQAMEPIYQMTNNNERPENQKLVGFTYRDYYDPANPRIFRPKEFRFEKKLGGTTKPLTQYPWGGPAFDPKNINTAVQNKKYQEGIKWHEDWMNSPMYKKMLYSNLDTSAKYGENEEDLKNIDSVRRNNLEALKQKPLNVSSNLHELSNYNGVALPAAAWYDSRPKDITVFGTGYGNPTLMEHEIRHAIDDHPDPYLTLTNIPIKDVAYLSKNEPATYPSGRFNFMYPHDEKNFRDSWLKQKPYYTSPTEVNARLSQIRKEAQEKGIYDPFTQSAPDDFLNREDTRHISPLLDLKKYYSDDQIKYMLNNFSYNDKQKNNTGIYQSKLGGSAKWLDQYDDGGAPCPAGYVMNFAGQCVPIRNQALNEDAVRAYNTYTTSGAAQVMPSLTQDVNAYAREQEARAANERKMKEDAARAYNRNTDYNTAQVQAQTKQNLEKEKGYKEAKARAENTGTITTADPKVVESMEKEVDPSKRTAWDYAKFYGNVLMDPLNAMKYSNEHGGRDMPIDYFSQQDYNPSLMLSALTVGAGLGAGAGRGALGVGSKVLGALDNSSLLGRVSSLANTALTTPLTIGSKVFPNANLGNYFLGQGLFNSYKNLVGPAAGYESPLYKSWGEFGNNPSMSSLGNALGETGMTAFGLYGPKWGEGFSSMADDASNTFSTLRNKTANLYDDAYNVYRQARLKKSFDPIRRKIIDVLDPETRYLFKDRGGNDPSYRLGIRRITEAERQGFTPEESSILSSKYQDIPVSPKTLDSDLQYKVWAEEMYPGLSSLATPQELRAAHEEALGVFEPGRFDNLDLGYYIRSKFADRIPEFTTHKQILDSFGNPIITPQGVNLSRLRQFHPSNFQATSIPQAIGRRIFGAPKPKLFSPDEAINFAIGEYGSKHPTFAPRSYTDLAIKFSNYADPAYGMPSARLYDKLARFSSDVNLADLTPQQMNAVNAYSKGYDARFNLRPRVSQIMEGRTKSYWDKQRETLFDAIGQNKVDPSRVQYLRRGERDYDVNLIDPVTFTPTGEVVRKSQLLPGHHYTDEGFLSTTPLVQEGSFGFPDASEIISVPRSGNLSFKAPFGTTSPEFSTEGEFLLRPGLIRRVKGTTADPQFLTPAELDALQKGNSRALTEIINPYKKGGSTKWLDKYIGGGPRKGVPVKVKDPVSGMVKNMDIASNEYRQMYPSLMSEGVDPATGQKTFYGAPMEELVFVEKRNKKAPKELSLEQRVNEWLGNPMKQAGEEALRRAGEGEDPGDSFRHSNAGRLTSEAIQNKFPEFMKYTGIPQAAGFLGATALGIGHEVVAPNMRPDYSWWDTTRESAEDIINNTIGASGLFSEDELYDMHLNNLMPDGYGKGNMYFKQKGGVKTSADGYIDYLKGKGSNAYSIFAKGGSKGWLDNYK